MYKFPSATCMVFIQWWCERGDKSHVSKEISGRGRRRSRGEKGNQGVGDFRFINILQFFLFIIIIILSLFSILFFTHDIYPHPHLRPTPTTSTHYPRLQGGKTFCASFCASLIAGSRRAFFCVFIVLVRCWSSE